MTFNNFTYIKNTYKAMLAIISIIILFLLYLLLFRHPANLIFPIIVLYLIRRYLSEISIFLQYREVRRRMKNLPIAKYNFVSWNYNNNTGTSFFDMERQSFWYCGTDTDFIVHVYPVNELRITEFEDRVEYVRNNLSFSVYRYTKIS